MCLNSNYNRFFWILYVIGLILIDFGGFRAYLVHLILFKSNLFADLFKFLCVIINSWLVYELIQQEFEIYVTDYDNECVDLQYKNIKAV